MSDFLYKDLSYKLRGIFFDIRNTYGPGHKESIYTKVLSDILESQCIEYQREKSIKIHTPSGKIAGMYRPDFVIDGKILLELKSSQYSSKVHEKQLYSYLRNSKYELGFLVNFSTSSIYIKRIVYSNRRKPFLSA